MTSIRVDEIAETITISGDGERPASASLIGPRARVDARITGGDETWEATFALVASRWG